MERRKHPRRRLDQLAYIKFGRDSGGVLLDVSEGGLRCQIVGAVIEGEPCRVQFALPDTHASIETYGHVVWSNKTKQGGGVRLLEPSPEVIRQLREWAGSEKYVSTEPAPPLLQTEQKLATATKTGKKSQDRQPEIAPPVVAGDHHIKEPIFPAVHDKFENSAILEIAGIQPQQGSAPTKRIALIAACILGALATVGFSVNAIKGSRLTGRQAVAEAPPVPARVSDNAAETAAVHATTRPTQEKSASPAALPFQPEHRLPASSQASQSIRIPISSERTPQQSAIAKPPANEKTLAITLARPRVTNGANLPVSVPEPAPAAIAPPVFGQPELEALLPKPSAPPPSQPVATVSYQEAKLVSRVEPVYSRFARDGRLQGAVSINVTIGTDGLPRVLTCITGSSALCQMAQDAIRKWRYQPATKNGQPVEAQTSVSFNFQLR